MRIIAHAKYNDHTDPIFEKFRILKFDDIYKHKIAKYMYELNNESLPMPLMKMMSQNKTIHQHNTRNANNPHVEVRRTNKASTALRHKGPNFWYKIPSKIRNIYS